MDKNKIVVYIVMSTKGKMAIATEDKKLSDSVLKVRNETITDPKEEVFGILTLSAPRDKAVRQLIKDLETKKK